MSTTILRAAPAQQPLRVGDRFPALKGQFLTGRDAMLPQASSGQVAFVPAHEDDAYLVVLDRDGVVRWLHRGGFEISRSAELKAFLASLVRPVER